jgi:hypothetical protein
MKKSLIIPVVAMLCSISMVALAQSSGSQAVPSPIGAHEVANTPSAMETPATIPGGLYRLANGFLSCPDTLPVTNGKPNLRSCTYVKDVH